MCAPLIDCTLRFEFEGDDVILAFSETDCPVIVDESGVSTVVPSVLLVAALAFATME